MRHTATKHNQTSTDLLMAVQPPSEPAGVRRACQRAFSPVISDSIGKPAGVNARRGSDRAKLSGKPNLDIPDFISFFSSSSSLEIRRRGCVTNPISRCSREIAKPCSCYRPAKRLLQRGKDLPCRGKFFSSSTIYLIQVLTFS